MQGLSTAVVFLTAVLTAYAVNPITRFGKCKNYQPATNVNIQDSKGVWYVQKRPSNPDNYAHTCQAQYEQQLKYFTTFLYYYNMGTPVNRPIQAEYATLSPGKYRGAITVDGEAVNIYLYVLYLDKDRVKVTYMCTDHKNANPNLDAIVVSTRNQIPSYSDLKKGTDVAAAAYRKVNNKEISLDQVVQSTDKCDPLEVYDSLDNPLLLS